MKDRHLDNIDLEPLERRLSAHHMLVARIAEIGRAHV